MLILLGGVIMNARKQNRQHGRLTITVVEATRELGRDFDQSFSWTTNPEGDMFVKVFLDSGVSFIVAEQLRLEYKPISGSSNQQH
jgi:hypothetical protein